jgi:hypothetical protein
VLRRIANPETVGKLQLKWEGPFLVVVGGLLRPRRSHKKKNTFGRLTQKQSRSYQSESFVAYFQMHRLKDEMTNRPMITCTIVVIICKGHECNFSQAAPCAYK